MHTFASYFVKYRFRNVLVILMAIVVSVSMCAQNQISVESFRLLENNSTGLSKPLVDNNNRNCALIIIHNISPAGYKFSTNNVFSRMEGEHTESGTGEKVIYYYVSEGCKKINIRHDDAAINPLNDYVFPTGALKSGRTYEMRLGKVLIGRADGTQYLKFISKTPGLSLSVEEDPIEKPGVYIPWTFSNGTASKALRYGTYKYKARAKDYTEDFGMVTVNNAPATVEIALIPNFGYLTIPVSNDLMDSKIYVDGELVGESSLNDYRFSAGDHELMIIKRLFEPYYQRFTISNGKRITIMPNLTNNSRKITILSPDLQAKIYLRQEGYDHLLGTGRWQGVVEPGHCILVAKRSGYKDALMEIDVSKSGGKDTFTFPALTATYGNINVTSTPDNAAIYLDGGYMGETPMVLNDIVAGKHRLEIKKDGFNGYAETVEVKDGETTDINCWLNDICDVDFITNASYLKVNNKLLYNKYTRVPRGSKLAIYASREGCKDYNKTITVESDTIINIKLYRNLLHGRDVYIGLGYVSAGYQGLGFSFGFNINKFNMQMDIDAPVTDVGDATPNLGYSFKLGWNINCGTCFRITPQIGYMMVFYEGDNSYWWKEDSGYIDSNFTIGVRMLLQTGYRFGLTVTPGYMCGGNYDGFTCFAGIVFNF